MSAAIGPAQLAGVAALPVRQSGLARRDHQHHPPGGRPLGGRRPGGIVATNSGGGPGTGGFADGFVQGPHISGPVTAAATLAAAALLTPPARTRAGRPSHRGTRAEAARAVGPWRTSDLTRVAPTE
ncbi:hypothetical protein ABT063_21895 [Streptomyces sp. NPDC002838]|uniref:hypothetical protein n=1 Tax=Streptomyces sp. NPDC002838 TaxID=3154436 RepID=UPI00333175B4